MSKYVLGILFLFALLVLAFISLTESEPLSEPEDEYELLTNREMWEHFLWVHKEYGFRPFCIGGNMPNGAVKTVDGSMRGDMKVSIDEARAIFLCCIQDLLNRINAKKELRPFLMNYPFTAANICYSIAFDDLREESTPPALVGHVQTFRKIIVYSVRDGRTRNREEVFRESYEDAERKASAGNCRTHTNAKL